MWPLDLGLFAEAQWMRFRAHFSHAKNPLMIICAWCKAPLNHKPKAVKISHGACWKCFYKVAGGRWFDLAIVGDKVKTLLRFICFKSTAPKATVVYDEAWTSNQLHKALVKNGRMIRKAALAGHSLFDNREEAAIIESVRMLARENGISERLIYMDEKDGQIEENGGY